MTIIYGRTNLMNLQATLSSSSAAHNEREPGAQPHHPITCSSQLRLEPDGTFTCDHAAVPGDDPRTRSCLNHSLALLLIELAQEL